MCITRQSTSAATLVSSRRGPARVHTGQRFREDQMGCQIILHVLTPAVLLSLSAGAQAQTAPSGGANMTFFITSVGSGKGADLGGLEGADRHCHTLAAAVGAGAKQGRAYLSTQGQAAVNARDRIGRGPWQN